MNIKKFSDVINNTDTSQEDRNKAIMGLMLETNLHVTSKYPDEIQEVGEILIEQVPEMVGELQLQAVLNWFADSRHNVYFDEDLKVKTEEAIKAYKKTPHIKDYKKTLNKTEPDVKTHKKMTPQIW